MKKKLTSILLSVTLVFQVGVMPQISAKRINNSIDSVVHNENSRDLNSKIICALKYVGETALAATGLYLIYNYLRPRPESIEVVPDAPGQPKVVPDVLGQPELASDAPGQSTDPLGGIPLANTVHPAQERTLEQRIRDFENTLNTYLNNDYILDKDEINQICDNAIAVLRRESSLLRIGGSTIVVGDIHSNIGSLEYSIRKFLKEVRDGKSILFLGDYVDRGQFAPGGPNGIKNVALLFKLKTVFPDKVFLLRGNHEDKNINLKNGFFGECASKYNESNLEGIYNKINCTFCNLSLAAVINNTIFCVHGGISPELNDLRQIHNIRKPLSCEELNKNNIAMDLLWSDPERNTCTTGFRQNRRGAGQVYGHDVSQKFLAGHNLVHIIRAHEAVNGHEDVFGNGSVITIFSAPDYDRKNRNIGEIAEINGDNISYEQIHYNVK